MAQEPAPIPYPSAVDRFPLLRQSLLASFDQCGLLAKFEVGSTRGVVYPWQARGRLFHRFAAKAMQEMWAQRSQTIPVDVALAILDEVLRQDDVDRNCPSCDSTKIRKGLNKDGSRYCLWCKSRFESEFVSVPTSEIADLVWIVKKFATDTMWSIENLVSIEERLFATIDYPNPDGGTVGRIVTGQLDVLFIENGHRAIVPDWKDTWKLPPPESLDSNEGYFQQRCYALLVMRNYRAVDEVVTREFYVRRTEPREAIVYRSQLDQIEREIAALVERFDRAWHEKIHRASPGAHCSYCPLPHRCPIVADVRGVGRIETDQQARQVAAELNVVEVIRKRNTAALDAWCDAHGPVPLRSAKGRREYGHRRTTATDRPSKDQLREAIERANAAGAPLDLSALYRERVSTRFDAHPPGADKPSLDEQDAEIVAGLQRSLLDAERKRQES